MNVGLYIHIPFCRFKCSYCDFNAYAGMRSLYEPYARAVATEISNLKSQISDFRLPNSELVAETIYFGGGTPSLLPLPLLAEILAACRDTFLAPGDAEISLEANPGTVDAAYLSGLRALGVNRLSLGVQSAHQAELDFLKRGHSFQDATEAVQLARAAGFDNLNIDLIYGIPRQTMAMWQETVDRTLGLAPDHVSMYCLTVEERTTLALWVKRGKSPPPDDDVAADMVLWADERLGANGLARYEISNWARRKNLQCRHNLVYWHNASYLGFGAGAHSNFDGRRFWNVEHPREYVRRIEAEQSAVADFEVIGRELEMGETMMLGLRLTEGFTFSRFEQRFGVAMTEIYAQELRELGEQGLIEVDAAGVRLTQRGWLLGNRVFAAFLPGPTADD
jgi:putative oxygen-independent coproporphyrinogen III oxidase